MQYVLTGFTHNDGFRIFTFEGIADDRVRTEYSIKADLELVRKYGIRVQELPLLCRAILERRTAGDDRRAFTYGEEDMSIHSDQANREPRSKGPRRQRA